MTVLVTQFHLKNSTKDFSQIGDLGLISVVHIPSFT
jgi:hypothetical protein